jgi:superfamily II DNA/RNA helicase
LAVRHFVDPPAGAVTTIAVRDRRVIMFVGTKHRADRLARYLLASGVPAAAPHGGKSQPQRTRALDRLRSGTVNALVATDPAARGIHLDLVVNVDSRATAMDCLHGGGGPPVTDAPARS